MKLKYIFLIFMLIQNLCLSGQWYDWTSEVRKSSATNCIFIDGNYFIASGSTQPIAEDSQTVYQISIYKVVFEPDNPYYFNLDEVKRWNFDDFNWGTLSVGYNQDNATWNIVLYTKIDGGHKYRISLFDDSFELLSQKDIESEGGPIIFNYENKYGSECILGSTLNPDMLFYVNFNEATPLIIPEIQIKQSTPNPMFWVSGMDIEPTTGDMLVFYSSGIARLDTFLNQKKVYYYTEIGTYAHGDIKVVGEHYFTHGCTNNDVAFGRLLVIQKYDVDFNVIATDTFGDISHDNYPFLINSLDENNGEIIIGGHLDGPLTNFKFGESIKKFYIAKYDLDLNRIWYKEYGGDKAYIFNGLKLLEDGGCLAYGFISDGNNMERFAFVMYIDPEGNITSTHQINNNPVTVRVINPGDENMIVLNPYNLTDTEITLFSLDGKRILRRILVPGTQELPVSLLPAGIYPYIITHKGKLYNSGKWVKLRSD